MALVAVVFAALLPAALAGPAQAAACPCSLWPDSVTPGTVDFNDTAAVELGTMFTSDVDGAVSGVRFYKSAANTGTHIGSLWKTDGTLLAQVTFTGETESGWQTASFSDPVAITAGTRYVISYHTPTGHYSADGGYFAAGDYDAAPLHAPGGPGNSNGLFAYSPVPTYPTGSFNSTNYWVSPVVTTTQAPTLTSLAVTPATTSVQAGQTRQLTATGTYSDGSTADLTGAVAWTATGSATVSATGLVTGVSAGSSTVTAIQGTLSASAAVTVTPAPVTLTSIAVTPANPSVVAGRSIQLKATGSYSDGTSADLTGAVTWAATGSAIVSGAGLVTGVSAGTSTVSASVGTVRGSTTVTVTPAVLTSIAVTPAAPKLIVGFTQQETATGTYSDGTTRAITTGVTWSSSSTTVATVSTSGLLTPKAAGTTTVTATVGSVSGSTSATVRTIRSITVSPALRLSIGARPSQLTATAALSDGTSVDVTGTATWTSTLPAIATVSASGLVTPKFIGVTTIKAAIGSVSGLSTIVVI